MTFGIALRQFVNAGGGRRLRFRAAAVVGNFSSPGHRLLPKPPPTAVPPTSWIAPPLATNERPRRRHGWRPLLLAIVLGIAPCLPAQGHEHCASVFGDRVFVGGIPVTGAAENSAALALGNLRVGADDIAFWSTGSRRLLLLAEGTGALLPYFLSLGVNVWAADPAYRAEVVQTSRGLKNYVTKFGPRLWPLAANELHKTDMLFDVVLAHHFLNNLSLQEALDVLPAVYARLEPGGEFRFNTGEAMALFLDERARSLPRREGEDATIEVSGDWVRLRRGQRSALRLDRRQEIARTTLARHSKGVVSGGLGLKTYLKEPGDFIDIFGLSPDEARAFAEKVARANPSVHDGEEVARRGLFSTRALAFTSTPRAFDATSERPIGLPPSLIVRLTRDF